MSIKAHIVRKGCKKPFPPDTGLFWPRYRVRKIDYVEIHFAFDESAFYDWGDDMDRQDWFKLAGLTGNWLKRDKNAVMIAARSIGQFMQVTAYTNQAGGRRIGYGSDQHILLLRPDEKARARIINLGNDKWEYQFFKGRESPVNNAIIHECELGKRAYKTGIYIAGANNSEGPFGGKASQKMKIYTDFKVVKK